MKLIHMFAAAALLASSHLAYGQETESMSVNVPFAFTAAGVSMPAGHYVLYRNVEQKMWRLRTFGHVDINVQVKSVPLHKKAADWAVVFDHDATGYTLRQINQEAQIDGEEILEPTRAKTRKSAAEQVATVTALPR